MIKSLGVICNEDKYCSATNIYPVGYKCVIINLPSLKRPGQTTTYTTTINKGEKGPIFEITCSDDPDFRLHANNASNVWNQLNSKWMALDDGNSKFKLDNNQKEQQKQAENKENVQNENDEQKEQKKETSKSPKSKLSGPKKIGLSHHDIKRAIECLPNAEKFKKYKFKYRTDLEATSTAKKAWKKTLRQKSKKDKKESKLKEDNNNNKVPVSITNISTVNNINIINNINISASPMAMPKNHNANIQNMQNKENPIVIEDSPTIGIVNVNVKNKNTENAVIDLCNSDVDDNGVEKTKIIKSKSRKRKQPNSPNQSQNEMNDDDNPKKKRKIEDLESQKFMDTWSNVQK